MHDQEALAIMILGWIGVIFLAFSVIPQALLCYRQGHARGLSKLMVWTLWLGGITMTAFTMLSVGWVWQLLLNFASLAVFAGVILKYVYWPRVNL